MGMEKPQLDLPEELKSKPARLPITADLSLYWDKGDSWFAIEDADWYGYDRAGAVLMGFDELDGLIEKLQELRELRKMEAGDGQ